MIIGNKDILTALPRTVLLAGVLLSLLAVPVRGQIVLDRDYIDGLIGETFDTAQYTAEDPEALQNVVDATGEDATYDFTAASYDTTLTGNTRYFNMPADFPGADDERFEEATFGARIDWEVEEEDGSATDSTAWAYYNLTDQSLGFQGLIYLLDTDDDASEDTLKITYRPAVQEYAFPVEYGDSWSSAAEETLSFFGFTFEDTVRYEYEVEGYGELITPGGSAQALLIRETTYSAVGTDTTDSTTTLHFETREGLFAAIELDEEGAPTDAWYTTEERASTAIADEAEAPADYELAQNYPNPFNPTTVITYSLPTTESVTLRVFDALGREVKMFDLGRRPPGTHRVQFDAASLPSGSYFYQIRAGDFTQTRQMMLMR